jgi:hypothetical protein
VWPCRPWDSPAQVPPFLDYIPQYIITWQQKCRIKAELRCTHTRVDSHVWVNWCQSVAMASIHGHGSRKVNRLKCRDVCLCEKNIWCDRTVFSFAASPRNRKSGNSFAAKYFVSLLRLLLIARNNSYKSDVIYIAHTNRWAAIALDC